MTALPRSVRAVVVGAGAAGLAAGRRLADVGVPSLVVEARRRVGGRAYTVTDLGPWPIDLGCGWLHSADLNPWTRIAEDLGFTVERGRPSWGVQVGNVGFSAEDQAEFHAARQRFFARIDEEGEDGPDSPVADLFEPGGRWNPLIDAINTYINGREAAAVSLRDFARYADTEVNWRVREGYGAVVAAHGAGLPVALGCAVKSIDHGGPGVVVETDRGAIAAEVAIVTVPTNVLAAEAIRFRPALPEKIAAAAGLPLGVADKLYLAIDRPEALPAGHVFGATDRTRTGSYGLKPLGRPLVEGYYGGGLARDLEAGGEAAFVAHALDELAGLFGNNIRARLKPVVATAWASDPLARGSYSVALPGHADDRARLAAPIGDRLFFAGEATSRGDYSTAHGAYRTGQRAAEEALSVLGVAAVARA